jgi:hypothetical protein
MEEIVRFRVMATPALVIDGEVKCAGRIPALAEIVSWLMTAAVKAASCADFKLGHGLR